MPLQTHIRFPFQKQNIIHHTQLRLLKSVLINSLPCLWSWRNKEEILKLLQTLANHMLNIIPWLSTILIAFNAVLVCTLIKLTCTDGYFTETYKTKTHLRQDSTTIVQFNWKSTPMFLTFLSNKLLTIHPNYATTQALQKSI